MKIKCQRPGKPVRVWGHLFERAMIDGLSTACVAACGASAETTELQVDHVDPVSAGGTDDEDNLVTACIACNLGKSDTLISAGADDA